MWRSKLVTPSIDASVIYVADEFGNLHSLPIVNNALSLRLLQLTFSDASGLCFKEPQPTKKDKRVSSKQSKQSRQTRQKNDVTSVKLTKGVFSAPDGGWFCKDRIYYVTKKTRRHRSVMAVELLRKYKALTYGVTIYLENRPHKLEPIVPYVPPGPRVVAAIDFGTSYSGYAYSLAEDPLNIVTRKWSGENMKGTTEKAPTTVLLRPDGSFHSFGYEAEDEYALLVDGETFHDWFYFRNFKMRLYAAKDLRRTTLLPDIDGKQKPALDIFRLAIRELKTMLHEDIRSRHPDVDPQQIMWVITVPAIWSDAAKQFMREATVTGTGIDNDSLRLVLEPEAASMYCKTREPADINVITGSWEGNPLAPGQRYILLDLGGGTADMSAHEVLEGGNLREIHRATGDSLGGDQVDEAFNRMLSDIFGAATMVDFFHDYRQDFLSFMREFEAKKRLPVEETDHVVFCLPGTLQEVLYNKSKTTAQEAVQNSGFRSRVMIKGDKMMIDGTTYSDLFRLTVDGIVAYIREMKTDDRLRGVNTLVLAGGFSMCSFLRRAIQKEFPDDLIVTPTDPGLAILKGAVLLGHRPETIVERVARYTYGVNYARTPFIDGRDPPELKAHRNGATYCDNVFEKLVEIGQPIKWSDMFTVNRTSHLQSEDSKRRSLHTKVYASIETHPVYCNEECFCVKIGEIIRRPPEGGWPDVMKTRIEIKFGETEMLVFIIEESTGVQYKARLDAL